MNELLANHLPAVKAYAAEEGIEVGQAPTELAGGNAPVATNLPAVVANPRCEAASRLKEIGEDDSPSTIPVGPYSESVAAPVSGGGGVKVIRPWETTRSDPPPSRLHRALGRPPAPERPERCLSGRAGA